MQVEELVCSSCVALSSKCLPRLDALGCPIRSSMEGDAYAPKCFRLGESVCLFGTELVTRDVDRHDVDEWDNVIPYNRNQPS